MTTHEIPEKEWPTFFRQVSARFHATPVTLRVLDPSMRLELESRVGFESAAAGKGEVSILLQDPSGPRAYRGLDRVAEVWHNRADDGHEEIEIDDLDGSRTTIAFPLRPSAAAPALRA